VHRLRIIDRGRNALRLQGICERFAIVSLRQADGVLRPGRNIAVSDARRGDDVMQRIEVALRDLVARGDFLIEDFQFPA